MESNNIWKLQNVLHMDISMLLSGTEILLCAAIHRLLLERTGSGLDLTGIKIHKELYKSKDLQILLQAGVTVTENISKYFYEETKENSIFLNYDYNKVQKKLKLYNQEQMYKHLNVEDVYDLFYNLKMIGYIYMCADVIVQNFTNNSNLKLHLQQSKDIQLIFFEYIDILILRDFGNQIYKQIGILDIYEYGKQDWETYQTYYMQRGYMLQETYRDIEKCRYTNQNYSVGEVVSLYEKEVHRDTGRVVNNIIGYTAAIIRKITEKGVYVDKIVVTDTKETQLLKIATVDKVRGLNIIAPIADTESVVSAYYAWEDTGVDGLINKDNRFFLTTVMDCDGKYQIVDGKEVFIDTIELLYKILNDYNIIYDRQLYEEKYLRNYFVRNNKYLTNS